MKLVSRRFANFSPETRLGLISFSDTAKLFIGFGEFERMSHPKRIDHFQKIVDELPYHGGRSRIDRALMAASEDLFTNRRPGVFRVSQTSQRIFQSTFSSSAHKIALFRSYTLGECCSVRSI